MDIVFARLIFIAVGIAIFYGLIKLISKMSQGKVKADLFAGVNLFLYFGLLVNLVFSLEESFTLITAGVIGAILAYRKKSSGRWI